MNIKFIKQECIELAAEYMCDDIQLSYTPNKTTYPYTCVEEMFENGVFREIDPDDFALTDDDIPEVIELAKLKAQKMLDERDGISDSYDQL